MYVKNFIFLFSILKASLSRGQISKNSVPKLKPELNEFIKEERRKISELFSTLYCPRGGGLIRATPVRSVLASTHPRNKYLTE